MLTFLIENSVQDEEAVSVTRESISHLKASGFDLRIEEICLKEEDHLEDHLGPEDTYLCFVRAGDRVALKANKLKKLLGEGNYRVIKLGLQDPEFPRVRILDKTKDSDDFIERYMLPDSLFGCILHKEILLGAGGCTEYQLLYQLLRGLEEKKDIVYVPEHVYRSDRPGNNSARCTDAMGKAWYLDLWEYILEPYLERLTNENIHLPAHVQMGLLKLTWSRFLANRNNSDKHAIDAQYPQYKQNIARLVRLLDDKVILSGSLYFGYFLLRLKYGNDFGITYEKGTSEPDLDGTTYPDVIARVKQSGVMLHRFCTMRCNLDLMEYDEQTDILTVEFQLENFMDMDQFQVCAVVDGKQLEVEETYRYTHVKFFGESFIRAKTYRIRIPMAQHFGGKRMELCFGLKYQGEFFRLRIMSKHYCARIASALPRSYWLFGGYMVYLVNGKWVIAFEKRGFNAFKKELAFFLTSLKPEAVPIKALGLRALYRITQPFLKNKVIWLTYDKLYKGGDCGEYLYKYMETRAKKDGIIPAYVVNGDAADFERLRKEGYKPLKHKSLKHYLYYLNSSVVFTTHGGVYNFNGLGKASIPYLQDLLRHDVACIQHGLTVQQLAHNSNRIFNNMKRYYCASRHEVENLSRPIYGYDDKSILKLTGIPRYDGLVNKDKHQILITPTWRNYIALPTEKKNQAKGYYDGFKETDYFKIYNSLLSDKRLVETARRTGYRLIYLLHPVVSAQLKDYTVSEGVEIVPALTVDYEKILTESSLMLTDYSGVQFDFAYMRKPIVYYHPPKLPPHYKEGGFFYDTMGFGEICTEHDELVELLCGYMENGCQTKPFYLERENDFFAHSDLDSCKRIYEDMLDYQKSKGRL